MVAAYSIKLERPLDEADAFFRSEALAREITDLDWTATEMGLRPLSEYCSPQFFSADDGVRTVQTLLREIAAWPPGVKETADILHDLKACERILCAAAECGVRFHFEVDVEHYPLDRMSTNWRFPNPPNLAVITLRSIVDGAPVLRVTHWHGWQFTSLDTPTLRDAIPVGLEELLALDPTLEALADLPEGWQASRHHIGDTWTRAPHDTSAS